MKTIAIGDGFKTAQFPDNMEVDWENNQNIIFYRNNAPFITERISVLTVTKKDDPHLKCAYDGIPESALQHEAEFNDNGTIRYFESMQDREEDGKPIKFWFFKAGINNHIVFTSVTIDAPLVDDCRVLQFLAEVRDLQFTLEDRTGKEVVSDLLKTNVQELKERIVRFLSNHADGNPITLPLLSSISQTLAFDPDDISNWHDMGLCFGELIRTEVPGFSWKLLHDEYGMDYCLRFEETSIKVFPMTLFSKRKEDGREIGIEDLYHGLLGAVGKMAKDGC